MSNVAMKLRVGAQNPAHTHVSVFTRLVGEGDVADGEWKHSGDLVFDRADWDRHWSVRFEAMGAEVETQR